MRLLLVEDDPMIGESIEEGLRSENYALDWVRDGHSAELAIDNQVYDLILLDLGLPKKQGLDVLGHYRKHGGDAAVLIITARDATADRVKGLDTGADDYLIKPFDLDELFARIRALLRRRVGRTHPDIVHCGLTLNLATHDVTFGGIPLHLSAREFAVLHALLDPPGQVISKAQLEEKLYGWNEEVESNTVDVYIHHLRKKLGSDFIKNVRGVGYKVANKP
ncbi:MAG TPA: response regulator transcription factor [Burkholderiaceae bacterium]|jgi:two-component system OmpR family response regulator/two-component system response regulator QseB|nr:response regulator transcription factor [Burkholderiaceae bacterium]